MKFLDKLLRPKSSPESADGAEARAEHLAPAQYFSPERSDATGRALSRCGFTVKAIHPID